MTSSALNQFVALALTLAVSAPGAPRELAVLCLGADGHVALEKASEPCRDATTRADDGDSACSDGCGPCHDVQLITGAHASGRPSNDSILAPLSHAAMPVWSLGAARDDLARRQTCPPSQSRADSGISSRALVALLI